MQLTVVIPTYNEADNLRSLVSALFDLNLPGFRVLVVDDNSPDGTGNLADDLEKETGGQVTVLHRPGKMGLGSAYIHGFQQAIRAGADAVGQMDADFSHPPILLPVLMNKLEECDVALGSRYVPGGAVDMNWPAWRKGLSAFGNIYARLILGLPVRDATGGYRIWRRATLLGIPIERIRSNGYAFQVETLYMTYRLGYSFREVPFYFADRKWGHSKMSFRIQREAALRIWLMLLEYRNLGPATSKMAQPGKRL